MGDGPRRRRARACSDMTEHPLVDELTNEIARDTSWPVADVETALGALARADFPAEDAAFLIRTCAVLDLRVASLVGAAQRLHTCASGAPVPFA